MFTCLQSILNSHGFNGEFDKVYISLNREPIKEELKERFFSTPYKAEPFALLDKERTVRILNLTFDTDKYHPECSSIRVISHDMIITITPKGPENPFSLMASIIYCKQDDIELIENPMRLGSMSGHCYE
jgi:hypothetical protein